MMPVWHSAATPVALGSATGRWRPCGHQGRREFCCLNSIGEINEASWSDAAAAALMRCRRRRRCGSGRRRLTSRRTSSPTSSFRPTASTSRRPCRWRTAPRLRSFERATSKITGTFSLGRTPTSQDFSWVNPRARDHQHRREVRRARAAAGSPASSIAINADGGKPEILVGLPRRRTAAWAPRSSPRRASDSIAAFLVDDLPADDKNVADLGAAYSADPFTRAERMDVYSGRRARVASAPVRDADFHTDNQGVVRFVTRCRHPTTSASCTTAPATAPNGS